MTQVFYNISSMKIHLHVFNYIGSNNSELNFKKKGGKTVIQTIKNCAICDSQILSPTSYTKFDWTS